MGSIDEMAHRKFVRRLVVTIFTFWFLTSNTSLAEWGVDVPIGHPRFCEMQEIRVSRIADHLYSIIRDRAIDTNTSGYILSSHTWHWKKQIRSMAGETLNKMPMYTGYGCADNADVAVRLLERIYQEVLRYNPNDASTFPCKSGPKGSCR